MCTIGHMRLLWSEAISDFVYGLNSPVFLQLTETKTETEKQNRSNTALDPLFNILSFAQSFLDHVHHSSTCFSMAYFMS